MAIMANPEEEKMANSLPRLFFSKSRRGRLLHVCQFSKEKRKPYHPGPDNSDRVNTAVTWET